MSTVVAASVIQNVQGVTLHAHRSRWGWHCLDYAGHLEVKRLHRLALADYAATRLRERRLAKLPHNRVRKDGSPLPVPAVVGTTWEEYSRILEAYRDVRTPKAQAELVRQPDLPKGWREKAEKYAEVHEAGDRPRAD